MGGLIVETDGREAIEIAMNERARKVWEKEFGPSAEEGIDDFGVTILKAAYGDENSAYGWNIDHIKPKSEGGSNALSNLRPLSIRANRGRNN